MTNGTYHFSHGKNEANNIAATTGVPIVKNEVPYTRRNFIKLASVVLPAMALPVDAWE